MSGSHAWRSVDRMLFDPKRRSVVFLAPALLFILGLIVVPMAILAWISMGGSAAESVGLERYWRFLSDWFYLNIAWRTIRLAIFTTVVALLIGYPLALFMLSASARVRAALILLLLAPLLTSAVVRVFGWTIVLANNGLINTTLLSLGVIGEPIPMIHTMGAVVAGLVNVELVFMVLPIYTSLLGMDPALPEAARSLGARPASIFRHVILPFSLPGVASGCAIVFALALSSFIQPNLLGGPRFLVMTTLMYQQATSTLDYAFAAAIGMLVLIMAFVPLMLLSRIGRSRVAGPDANSH